MPLTKLIVTTAYICTSWEIYIPYIGLLECMSGKLKISNLNLSLLSYNVVEYFPCCIVNIAHCVIEPSGQQYIALYQASRVPVLAKKTGTDWPIMVHNQCP